MTNDFASGRPAHEHLTEEERQRAADGSLAPEGAPAVKDHLHGCADCAADVARLKTLLAAFRDAGVPEVDDDLWPEIRARIEQSKVVALDVPVVSARRSTRLGRSPL